MQSPLRRITNTTDDGISLNPSISGDGRFVAFESTKDIAAAEGPSGFRALRVNISVDPFSFIQMGRTRAPAPGISQDGSRIVFASRDDPLGTNVEGNSEIFLYDGTRLVQITNTSPGDISTRVVDGNFSPSISDDGRFIAFSSNRNLTSQNADGNREIVIHDAVTDTFTQLTNSSSIFGFTEPKISGSGASVAYIRDNGSSASASRDLILQNRSGIILPLTLATKAPALAFSYGRAISDDGQRVVWSAETATNSSQVFLYDGRNNNTRQVTTLGTRATDVPLHPTISGDGNRISFATRRSFAAQGSNTDSSVELYTYDIPSGTFGRVTNVNSSSATAEVVSSLSDNGAVIAFNYPRILSDAVSNTDLANNSEIYVTATPSPPTAGTLTMLNRASFGHEPSPIKAVSPDSIGVALGHALAFSAEQSQRQLNGAFPTTVGGTKVTVNGQPAQIFYVSPAEVHFHIPATTLTGIAEVVVTNSEGFQSRGNVNVLTAAPGLFTKTGDGLGEGIIINADTLEDGPLDPTNGNLRLIIFSTGVRNAATVSITAGGTALTVESIVHSSSMPGLDEIHALVPRDLRGAGKVDLVVKADGRDSNPVSVTFTGDTNRDVLINEFLADPPDGAAGDANRDNVRGGSDDEFIELVNTTTHDIDISGYQIFTRSNTATNDTLRHVFSAGTILPSCTAIIVFGGGRPSSDPAFGAAQIVTASGNGLSLTNAGGVISLRDQTNALVNSIAYGGSTGLEADDNQSLTRSPDLTGLFAQHLAASGGTLPFSPGTRLSGVSFSSCTPAVARVVVAPASARIDSGGQRQFTAQAFDAGNSEIPGVLFAWQSSNTSAATIDQKGLAIGVSAGFAEIRATGRGVTSAPATVTVNDLVPPDVVINEVDSDQLGTDAGEFVEIYDGGAGNTSLTGLVVVFFNGGDDRSYAAFDLDGVSTGANGYFTLGNAAVPGVDRVFADGAIQNGPDAVAIYVGNASDFPNGTNVTTTNLIDVLVYDTNDADDAGLLALLNVGQPQVNEDGGGNGFTNSNQRCPNGSGGARNTSTYNQFAPTPDGPNICIVPPALSINDVFQIEGNSGINTFTFTISLSAPAPDGGVTLDIATADNTATVADSDYASRSVTRHIIAPGNSSYIFDVTVNGDLFIESDETFLVNVTNVSGATVADGEALGTIQNDDSPTLSIDDVSANEGDTGARTFTFTVTSSLPAPSGGITFDIATQDNTATAASGDYVARSLTNQTISSGNTTYAFEVTVNGDTLVELNESFFVNVTARETATGTDQAAGAILNDDAANLLISQVFAGGGNAGAQFTHDFVELFNHGSTTVNFATTPYSLQYAGGVANFGSSKVDLTSGTMAPGQYFLVQLGGGTNGVSLPSPDATGTTAMAATAGKIALVAGRAALPALTCPGDDGIAPLNPNNATIMDLVGYGNTAACYEGPGPAPAPSNSSADFRKNGGCTDTNDNAADLFVHPPAPRNSVSPLNNCVAGAAPNLAIDDVSVAEGNSGTITATFTVRLSSAAPSTDVTFDIATQNNTATTANNDYVVRTLTSQTIPAGQDAYTFAVTINGDTSIEPDETFFVNVTNVSGAIVIDGQGLGTIQNDDLPALVINDVSLSEGNAGTILFTFTVSLSNPAPSTVSFDIATADGTAQDGDPAEDTDYVAKALTAQHIPAGSQTYTFNVTVNGDLAIEANDTFFVNVTNVLGASVADGQGQGTIQDDDSPSLSISDVVALETNGGPTTFAFTVTSSLPAPTEGITFDIATADGTAQDDNPVSEDNDYSVQSLTGQTITAGNTTYTFYVSVNGDTLVEGNETFFVNISNVTNVMVSDGQGQGIITNDDTPNIVISQVYGGGGNASATYTHDFIEIFNRGNTTVDFSVTAYSVQYAASTSNFSTNKTDITSGILLPGHYFLIREATGGAIGTALPTPDANGSINLAATAGKVALVLGTGTLSGNGCPTAAPIVDFLGYGAAANCSETLPVSVSSTNPNVRSVIRTNSCNDTNNNSADFSNPTTPPVARNTATAPVSCP